MGSFLTRLRHAWTVLTGREPKAQLSQEMKMALADDILAVFPKCQAAVADKDNQIAALTAQNTDLQKQISDAEAAVLTLTNEVAPPAPEPTA